MIDAIDAFIFALSPAASVFASAIFLYESVMMDSNWGSCSVVSFKVVFHFASASWAFSSGVFAGFVDADFSGLLVASLCAKAYEANANRNSGTRINRAHFMKHLPEMSFPLRAVGGGAECSRGRTLARALRAG